MNRTLIELPRLMEDTQVQYFTVRRVALPMKFTFKTAKTELPTREVIVLEAHDGQGHVGYGEDVAFTDPFYTEETLNASEGFMTELAIPYLFKVRHELRKQGIGKNVAKGVNWYSLVKSMDAADAMAAFETMAKEFPMAIAAIEMALLDLAGRQQGWNLVEHVMGQPLGDKIPIGIALGDLPLADLMEQVSRHVAEGCQRIKLKVKPTDGVAKTRAVRNAFPHIDLAVDANGSYALIDWQKLKDYDDLGLKCIEEPFPKHLKLAFHDLKKRPDWNIRTPICLDESVMSLKDLQDAREQNRVDVLNVKVGRLGGLYNTLDMIRYCRDMRISYWVGSMVESSISKMLHVQLASLGDSYMAGDLSDSSRYFTQDLTLPDLHFESGFMAVPNGPGLGVEVDREQLDFCTYHRVDIRG